MRCQRIGSSRPGSGHRRATKAPIGILTLNAGPRLPDLEVERARDGRPMATTYSVNTAPFGFAGSHIATVLKGNMRFGEGFV